ncbi:MAG: MFS transporter [Alphaproteobacteria bacterium]|nr:MFS transporter [Alphaproteobacteria bacterium]
MTAPKRTPWQIVAAYALPAFPIAAFGMPLVVHLPSFYASKEVGIPLAVVGAIFGLIRIIDIFVDPIAGYVSDRWRSRFGRRRPIIALGTPVFALGIWLAFVPGGAASAAYLTACLMVMYLGYSAVVVPHLSWGAEISGEYHERSRVYGWYQFLTVAGMMCVLIVPAVLEGRGYPLSTQVMAMAAFAIAAMIPSIAICLAVVPEPEVRLGTQAGLWPTLRFLLKNDAVRRVILVDLIESTNQGARGAMFLYFIGLGLALPKFGGTLLLVYFLSGVVCAPVWIALSRRIGKSRTLIASYVYGIATGLLLFAVPPGSKPAAMAVIALTGAAYAAPAFLIRAMMADVADADTYETGAERAGLLYAFLTMTSKLGIGWSVTIAFGLLAFLGFDPRIRDAAGAIDNLRLVYILMPIGLAAVSLVTMIGYPLNEARQRALRDEIERRRAMAARNETAAVEAIAATGAAE